MGQLNFYEYQKVWRNKRIIVGICKSKTLREAFFHGDFRPVKCFFDRIGRKSWFLVRISWFLLAVDLPRITSIRFQMIRLFNSWCWMSCQKRAMPPRQVSFPSMWRKLSGNAVRRRIRAKKPVITMSEEDRLGLTFAGWS